MLTLLTTVLLALSMFVPTFHPLIIWEDNPSFTCWSMGNLECGPTPMPLPEVI